MSLYGVYDSAIYYLKQAHSEVRSSVSGCVSSLQTAIARYKDIQSQHAKFDKDTKLPVMKGNEGYSPAHYQPENKPPVVPVNIT